MLEKGAAQKKKKKKNITPSKGSPNFKSGPGSSTRAAGEAAKIPSTGFLKEGNWAWVSGIGLGIWGVPMGSMCLLKRGLYLRNVLVSLPFCNRV